MGKLLLVEDQTVSVPSIIKILKEIGENADVVHCDSVEALEKAASAKDFFDDIEIALVDLELGPAFKAGPQDYLGRDSVLPLLRERACWLPVILISRYIGSTQLTLAELSPYGFDAIIHKDFLGAATTYKREWFALRKNAALNRIASLTGRHVDGLQKIVNQPIKVDCGAGVSDQIAKFDRPIFEEVLKLMAFGSGRVVLDEVVHGFSGLSTLKITSRPDAKKTCWLLKCGIPARKLDEELTAHRRMFTDGLTRHFSVPPYWWAPVVWKTFGAIAYEFDSEANSLLSKIKDVGFKSALEIVTPMLKEFYRGTTKHTIIPRNVLSVFNNALSKAAVSLPPTVKALVKSDKSDLLDKSLDVGGGCEHGDLHNKNIMISRNSPVLIDFAHYKSREEGGVPLLDLAKLLVDSWAFVLPVGTAGKVLSGTFLEEEKLNDLTKIYSLNSSGLLDEHERRLLSMAVQCIMTIYLGYPDVPAEKKKDAKKALMQESDIYTYKHIANI